MATFIMNIAKNHIVNINKICAIDILESHNEKNVAFYNVYAYLKIERCDEHTHSPVYLGRYKSYDTALQEVKKKFNVISLDGQTDEW